jgi:hypothetical protein
VTEQASDLQMSAARTMTVLDVVAKAAALAGAALYFLGLLVITLRLQEFGVGFLGFFEVPYVIAGVWATFPLAVGASVRLLAQGGIRWSVRAKWYLRVPENIFIVLVLGFFLFALAATPLLLIGVNVETFDQLMSWLAVFGLSAWIANPDSWRARGTQATPKQAERILAPAFYALISLAPLFMYASVFSTAYSTIPARWGGGAATEVSLALPRDVTRTLVNNYGFDREQEGIRARVLLITRDDLVLAPVNSSSAVVLRRSLADIVGFTVR